MLYLNEEEFVERYEISDVEKIEIKRIEIPLRSDFAISGGRVSSFKPILITLFDSQGRSGHGILDNFSTAVYDGNTTDSSWVHLRDDYLIRLSLWLKERPSLSIFALHHKLNSIRDPNNFALSAIEMATWDLLAKQMGKSCADILYDVFMTYLSEMLRFSKFDNDEIHLINQELEEIHQKRKNGGIPSKCSIGLKAAISDYTEVIDEVVSRGIDAVKVKITPKREHSVDLLSLLRDHYPDLIIDTDANASFIPRRDIYGKPLLGSMIESYRKMDPFHCRMHEQPSVFLGDHLEIMKELQSNIDTAVCPDESIHGPLDFVKWRDIMLEKCPKEKLYVNIKLHRTGGVLNCLWILAMCKFNNLTSTKKIIPWAGYMPDQELSANVVLTLFSLPVETSHTDVTDHDYWFENSVFDKTIRSESGRVKPIHGEGFGIDPVDSEIQSVVSDEFCYRTS